MIGNLLGQLFLSLTVTHLLPIDAANLEWRAAATPATALAASSITQQLSYPTTFLDADWPTLPPANDRPLPPRKVDATSYGLVTSGKSVVVVDAASGELLFAKSPQDVRAIGSITKLVTALVFLDTEPDLTRSVTIEPDDYVGGGRLYIRFDDALTLYDVLAAGIVGSDNTAMNSLVRFSGLSIDEYVVEMNAKAAELGMTGSHFVDASGVGGDNVSTAMDLVTLLSHVKQVPTLEEFMTSRSVVVSQVSGASMSVESTDQLLSGYVNNGAYEVTAGKTGYIPQAGYCLATAIKHEGHEIYIVVLGAETLDDRFIDAKNLALWTFKTFSWE